MIIAVDPGKLYAGIASYDNGAWASQCVLLTDVFDDLARRVRYADDVTTLIMELPNIHDARSKRMDAKDFARIAVTCGVMAAHYPKAEHVYVTAQEWKGSVPKKIHHARLAKTAPAIWATSNEHSRDAIGMIMWWLARHT